MAITRKSFTEIKNGDDQLVVNLMAAINEGFEILGKGKFGIEFHISKNTKPFFLLRIPNHPAKAVFVSTAVAKEINNLEEALEKYPVRSFTYPELVNDVPTGETRDCLMLCKEVDPANAKYVSMGERIIAIKAEQAAQKAEATKLAQDAQVATAAALALQTANAGA